MVVVVVVVVVFRVHENVVVLCTEDDLSDPSSRSTSFYLCHGQSDCNVVNVSNFRVPNTSQTNSTMSRVFFCVL